MLTQEIPYFNERSVQGDLADQIRASTFNARIRLDMTKKEKTALQEEFTQAILEALAKVKKEHNKKVAELSKLNTQAFIDHPREVVEELKDPTWTVPEMMVKRNIGKAKMIRKGKGVLSYKGTDFPCIVSEFEITIVLGKVVYKYSINSTNERHDKERNLYWAYRQVLNSILGEGNW